jgi:hypothetical protein
MNIVDAQTLEREATLMTKAVFWDVALCRSGVNLTTLMTFNLMFLNDVQ